MRLQRTSTGRRIQRWVLTGLLTRAVLATAGVPPLESLAEIGLRRGEKEQGDEVEAIPEDTQLQARLDTPQ